MKLSLIVAMTRDHVIGNNNALPWHLPADLKRFKALTTGHPIIMGRKTFESIGKPLPNRTNIVISRQSTLPFEGIELVGSLQEALELAGRMDDQEVFVIGGGQIFSEALTLADKLYVTWIEKGFPGDAKFPHTDWSQFVASAEEKHGDPFPYSYVNYERQSI